MGTNLRYSNRTSRVADYLAEWRPFSVAITLCGTSKDTYGSITRTPGPFKRCRRGFDSLLRRKIPLCLKTMVMTLNRNELFQIKEYAEELGLKFRFDPTLNPRLDRSKTPRNLGLSPEEVVKLDLAEQYILRTPVRLSIPVIFNEYTRV